MIKDEYFEILKTALQNESNKDLSKLKKKYKPLLEQKNIYIAGKKITGSEKYISLYIPIQNEQFYYYFNLNLDKKVISQFSFHEFNKIYFRATSYKYSLNELIKYYGSKPDEGWSKGDKRKIGDSFYKFSSFKINGSDKPEEFETKLKKLLKKLEKNKKGVKNLAKYAYGHIMVWTVFPDKIFTGLGGYYLDSKVIKSLNDLGLFIQFDIY